MYSQLSSDTRRNFTALIDEIEHRFRKIESARTYGSQFSKRSQKPGETVEDFAAELKRLYHKAYPRRDIETRREDLLRRFLDGSFDQSASFQVEYVKQPIDIDNAVFELVTFQESKKQSTDSHHSRSQRPVRGVNDFEFDVREGDGYDDSGEDIRGVSYPKKQTGSKVVCTNSGKTPISTTTNDSTLKQDIIAEITKLLQNKSISIYPPQMATNFQNSNPRESSICYRCKEIGHYARDCTNQYRPTNYHGATVPSYQAIQPNSQVLQNRMPHQPIMTATPVTKPQSN